jgi:hypothetical protein
MQNILTDNDSKSVTELERLMIKRKALYDDLIAKIQRLQIRKKDLVIGYRMRVKDIDALIDREKRKQKTIERNKNG